MHTSHEKDNLLKESGTSLSPLTFLNFKDNITCNTWIVHCDKPNSLASNSSRKALKYGLLEILHFKSKFGVLEGIMKVMMEVNKRVTYLWQQKCVGGGGRNQATEPSSEGGRSRRFRLADPGSEDSLPQRMIDN